MADWMEVDVPVAPSLADDLAALIADGVSAARSGTQVQSGRVRFWVEVDRAEDALLETRAFVAALAARGMAVEPAAIRIRPAAPEATWRDAWKRYFHVTRLTRQIVIVPSWEAHEPLPDDLVVHLDPGQAFGTGTHASTRLVLDAMQDRADAGLAPSRVLDLGTGSGILAIAAVRLWPACEVVAVDVDPLAVDAARANAAANGVADRVRCRAGEPDAPVSDADGAFDLVLANIQAHVLRALRDRVAARVAAGGALILSGLLTNQADDLARRYADAGLAIDHVRASDIDPAWSRAALRR